MNKSTIALLSFTLFTSIAASAQPIYATINPNSLAPVPGTITPMSLPPLWWGLPRFSPPTTSGATARRPVPPSCVNAPTHDMSPNGWFMHWDFNTLDGCLIFTDSVGKGLSYDTIPCKIIGNPSGVRLSSGQATFNGTGGLECQIPANYIPVIQAYNYSGFLMGVDYVPNTPKNATHPIIWHHSARLEVIGSRLQPVNTINSYYRDTTKRPTANLVKYSASSGGSRATHALSHIGKNQWLDHFADTMFLPNSHSVANFKFDPTQSTIYLGYNPTSGNYLNAIVKEIMMDPGCYD